MSNKNTMIKVLYNLPPKSLIRFKLVSKDWSNLIGNSDFVSKNILNESIVNSDVQSQDANPRFILIKTRESIDPPKQLYSFHSFETLKCSYQTSLHLPLPETSSYQKLDIVACCRGLICLYDFSEKREIYVWNPIEPTPEHLPSFVIPYVEVINIEVHCVAFGVDPQTDELKILRVIRGDDTFCMNAYQAVELFSLHSRSWKQLNRESDVMFSGILDNKDTQAYLEGFSFWYADATEDNAERIVRFDFSKETFQTTLLPDETVIGCASNRRHILKALNKSLSLVVLKDWNKDPYFEIWVLLEFEVRASWTKLFKIDCSNDIRILLGFWKNAKIFLDKKGELVLFDPLTKSIESVHPGQISKELELVQCSVPKEYVELTKVWWLIILLLTIQEFWITEVW